MLNRALPSIGLASIAMLLALSGCTIRESANGTQVSSPLALPPVSPVGPPPGSPLAASGAPTGRGAGPASWDGNYTGQGTLERDIGGMCQSTIAINNMQVTGDQVSFGSFNGTIDPSGNVTMAAGPNRVYGHFTNGRFSGQFWAPPPTCTYNMQLSRGP
jgi:hypothetical protein